MADAYVITRAEYDRLIEIEQVAREIVRAATSCGSLIGDLADAEIEKMGNLLRDEVYLRNLGPEEMRG